MSQIQKFYFAVFLDPKQKMYYCRVFNSVGRLESETQYRHTFSHAEDDGHDACVALGVHEPYRLVNLHSGQKLSEKKRPLPLSPLKQPPWDT